MADEGVNSAGSVSVDVVPDGKQFGSRLKALVVAAGNSVAKDLAGALSSKIADSIVESVVEGVADGGRAAIPEAAKAGAEAGTAYGDAFRGAARKGTGDVPFPGAGPASKRGAESGGAFADAFKARVEGALRSLPPIEIGAAATEAEQKIRDIKIELAELSGQRVGIDIGDAEAVAKIDNLRIRLRELCASSASVQVKADTAAAIAQLEAVKAEVNSVDSAGLSAAPSLGALATTIVTLLPAAIPIAAAAAAAIAGIGAAGLGAAAGIGVEALALSRVIGVVKDMSAAQKSQNAAVAGGTSNAFAYASAVDGLKSAQAAYANTVANAANAQRQAAEAVVNAERSVVDAQRAALQAQVALTAAKKQAAQQEQDLANSITDGVISQQQAALDLQTAQKKLAQLQNARVAATDPQLIQAQIDVEAAQQRVNELAISQQRLTDQQTQATKTGIAGAAGVVSAQQGVVSANEQVAKAEQSLSDARIAQAQQARQAAYSIAQAQQGIVAAQRSLEQATAGVGGASTKTSAATTKLQQDLAKLTPEGRAFATYLFSLKGDVSALQGIAEKGVLPGAEELFKSLISTYGPGVKSTVSGIAGEIGHLETSAGQTFTNPFWQHFFGFLEADAVPALDGLYKVGVNVATGLAGIVRAGEPLARDFGGGLLSFSQRFADSAKNLQDNPAFQHFLADVEREGPQVAHTVEEVATALVHVTAALSPIGNAEIRLIGDFADAFNHIPVPVLTALAGAFIVVNLGLKVYNAYVAVTLAVEKAWGVTQKVIGGLLDLLPGKAAAAAVATEGLAAGETAAADAAIGAKASVGLLSDLLGGPLGIALALAGAAFVLFSNKTHDNTAEVGQLTSALGQLADAYRNVTTNGTASIDQLVAQNTDLQQFVINANRLGIAVGTIQSALSGDPQAAQAINDAYEQRIALIQKAVTAEDDLVHHTGNEVSADQRAAGLPVNPFAGLDKGGDPNQKTLDALKAQQAAYQKQTGALQQAAAAQNILNAAQNVALGITSASTPAEVALANSIEVLGTKSSSASDQVSALKSASDALYGSTRAAADANEAYYAAIDQVNGALVQNGRSLDLAKASGRANTDAIKAQLDASNQLYFADIADGKSAVEAAKAHDARTAALVDETKKGHLNQTAVKSLIDTYGQVPQTVTTEISVTGAQSALTQLQNLQIAQQALASGIPIDQAAKEYKNSLKQAQKLFGGLAAGGPVSGLLEGPGTKTSDSILLWGSRGEFMQPAHAVDYYGVGAMEAVRSHAIPKEALQGLAHGGPVKWPFRVNETGAYIPSMEHVRAVMAGHVPHYASGGYLPPGLSPSYSSTSSTGPDYPSTAGPAAAAGPRTQVTVGTLVAADADPHAIASELDWIVRTRGGL